MRKLALFAAAFVVASLAFWGTMLTAPPRTQAVEADRGLTLDPLAMMRHGRAEPEAAYDAN